MRKRVLSVLMTLCMVLTLLPVSALAANDGNQDHFIEDFYDLDYSNWTPIATVEDLDNIREDLSGAYYLTADIDLSGQEWTPIGTQSQPFTGLFSGCGYTIRNLTISSRTSSISDYGLFGALGGRAQVLDLGLENVNIDLDNSSGSIGVGGLAGTVTNRIGSGIIIQNCYVTGRIAVNGGSAYVGGLFGRTVLGSGGAPAGASLYLNACYNRASVTASAYSSSVGVGGLIGAAMLPTYGEIRNSLLAIENSFNAGDMTGFSFNSSAYAGGLVGSDGVNTAVVTSYNSGAVTATGGGGSEDNYAAGGLAGYCDGFVADQCYNSGDVSAIYNNVGGGYVYENDYMAGGFVGRCGYPVQTIDGYNSGDVYSENSLGESRAAGLIGLVQAVPKDLYLGSSSSVTFNGTYVLSDSVSASGYDEDVSVALVYTTNPEPDKWVDNGFGNVLQPGTKSPVTSNTAVAVEGITGNAEDNAYRRISRDQAADLIGTAGWDTATWKMMSGYDYPQLSWQTEELNNPTSQITDFITFTARKSSDVYTGNAFTLSDFVNEATYSDGAATFTYTIAKDNGQPEPVADLTAYTFTDAGTYTVTATATVGGETGEKSVTFTIEKADRAVSATLGELYIGNSATVAITDNAPVETEHPTYTYTSSNPAIATVNEQGVVTPVAVGEVTITVTAAATANYKEGTVAVSATVTDLPLQEVAFTETGDKTATYGEEGFTRTATNATQDGGAITYASSNPDVATVDSATGAVTIVGAGETTISATAAGVEGRYAPTTVEYKLTVAPKEITAEVAVAAKTFDGTTEASVIVTFTGTVAGDDVDDYTATAAFADPNAGTGKEVNITIAITDPNYTLSNPSVTVNSGVINKAAAQEIEDQDLPVRYDDTTEKTFDLSLLMPDNAGELTYALSEASGDATYSVREDTFVYRLAEGLTEDDVQSIEVPVTITSQNYEDSTVNMIVRITDKYVPVLAPDDVVATYDGAPVEDSAITGSATVNSFDVSGEWSFVQGQNITNVKDSGLKFVTFTPADLSAYETVKDTVLVTISKADPDGEPSYTAITGSGHTLADAALNKGTIAIPGAIVWDDGDDTVVEANTAYGWTFTPEDADNYNILTGTITPYVRSSGGGSGSGSSSTTRYSVTVKNSDNGDVEANVSRAAKGDTVTLTVTPDEGYVLDTLTVTAANGDKINLNRGSNGRYTFEMPASRVTVEATFVEDGGEEAAKPFVDVSAGDWFYDAVVYVYDNGLMSGTAATTFGPNVGTTRGMIAIILWRLAGSPNGGANPFTDVSSSDYYAEAVAWAAGEGIVGGYGNGVFGANDPITREQMALMMYRYAQYAGYETSQRSAQLSSYADYASISDWAVEAVSWANAVGLMNGRTARTIVPTGTITRAEAATILMQFGENVQK